MAACTTCPGKTKNRFEIAKISEEQRLVFGWANISMTKQTGELIVDTHGDLIYPEDLEGAAYDFVLKFREGGEMHVGAPVARIVESFVSTPEKLVSMGLAKNALPTGWWIGMKIYSEAAWAKVKKGEYKMFSIQGTAEVDD